MVSAKTIGQTHNDGTPTAQIAHAVGVPSNHWGGTNICASRSYLVITP